MFSSMIRFSSRTTYRGSRGSGSGQSGKTSSRSSPSSRPTLLEATLAGRVFKRSQRGLYDGSVLQSGNNLPKSRHKTPRTWSPNLQKTKLFSEVLGKMVELKLTTGAMRTIRKLGGLDRYLVGTKDEVLGEFGRGLREKLGRRLEERKRVESQLIEVKESTGGLSESASERTSM